MDTVQARTYTNDGAVNWRGSGKLLSSPLRGAPIWSAQDQPRSHMDISNNTAEAIYSQRLLLPGKQILELHLTSTLKLDGAAWEIFGALA